MRSSKGSQFERAICKKLSLWWSDGETDDIFWRSQTSGGRATLRRKKGKTTYGSYGDIAAVDPRGTPLIKLWTIELKRGKSHGSPWEMLECRGDCKKFEKTIQQTYRSHQDAKSLGWMLICQKDYHNTMVYVDWATMRNFSSSFINGYVRYSIPFRIDGEYMRLRFVGVLLEDFLKRVTPDQIKLFMKASPLKEDNRGGKHN